MDATTMTSKGQVTIPQEVRKRLGLKAGDKFVWSVVGRAVVMARPQNLTVDDIAGILGRPGQPKVPTEKLRFE